MQIAVTNQKTKSIRSASFDDCSGSQGTKIATAVASAANTRETRRTLISDPARTAREPTELVARLERVHKRWLRRASAQSDHEKEALNGTRSKPVADRRRGDSRVGSAERRCRHQRGCHRRHPDRHRRAGADSLDDV